MFGFDVSNLQPIIVYIKLSRLSWDISINRVGGSGTLRWLRFCCSFTLVIVLFVCKNFFCDGVMVIAALYNYNDVSLCRYVIAKGCRFVLSPLL